MSAGRCTKGIYGTLLTHRDTGKYVLLLDTEGMLSIIRNDPTFDRKVAMFCLAMSDIVIINVHGEVNKSMSNLLEICTKASEKLGKLRTTPIVEVVLN